MAKQCGLVIGYLFPRRCEEKAADQCVKCKRDVCQHHTRIGDAGLLCRDCYETGQPLAHEKLTPMPELMGPTIYRRDEFGSFDPDDEDYLPFEEEKEEDVFSTLS